ncbi:DUF58 domain-containing protein [Pseudofulvibacter geojedonensis]|uniref:DUF58 domain-containing protein n=1 Tax=Pseudofulvibacter geojedonensis TaxID=1123758 RepID=A0ABW3I6P6_9FLAO
MAIKDTLHQSGVYFNLQLLASQIVEGFITGMHRSPFHGFSSEFAEHKVYNNGESTKHIDWKLFARTDKLYTKKYEEETNLRCHLIIDNSASMHYPKIKDFALDNLNKIGFSVLASAAIMQLLKKQRDAVGMSVYHHDYEVYFPEKGSDRHYSLLMHQLEETLFNKPNAQDTNTVRYLHEIAEKMKRRSLVVFFTDMFQYSAQQKELFDALKHLKYNKHEVVLFHTLDYATEVNFNFDNTPKSFVDVETGEKIELYADNIKKVYQDRLKSYIKEVSLACANYNISYVSVDIAEKFDKILNTYLVERQRFV